MEATWAKSMLITSPDREVDGLIGKLYGIWPRDHSFQTRRCADGGGGQRLTGWKASIGRDASFTCTGDSALDGLRNWRDRDL